MGEAAVAAAGPQLETEGEEWGEEEEEEEEEEEGEYATDHHGGESGNPMTGQ